MAKECGLNWSRMAKDLSELQNVSAVITFNLLNFHTTLNKDGV